MSFWRPWLRDQLLNSADALDSLNRQKRTWCRDASELLLAAAFIWVVFLHKKLVVKSVLFLIAAAFTATSLARLIGGLAVSRSRHRQQIGLASEVIISLAFGIWLAVHVVPESPGLCTMLAVLIAVGALYFTRLGHKV